MTALGARCPHCGTFFKVFPDHLRLHNGYANCGQCGQTFDVQAGLMVLPSPNETSFLPEVRSVVDGLPILNAVVNIIAEPTPSPLPPTVPPTSTTSDSAIIPPVQSQPTPATTPIDKSPITDNRSIQIEHSAAHSMVETIDSANNPNHPPVVETISPSASTSTPTIEEATTATTTSFTQTEPDESLNIHTTTTEIEDAPTTTKHIPQTIIENKAFNQKLPTLTFVAAPDLSTLDKTTKQKKKHHPLRWLRNLMMSVLLLALLLLLTTFIVVLFTPAPLLRHGLDALPAIANFWAQHPDWQHQIIQLRHQLGT